MEAEEKTHLTLIDHLTELRYRLIRSAFAILIGTLIAYNFTEKIFDIIRKPVQKHLQSSVGGLVFTAPMDKFMAHIKIAVLSGVILSCPYWLFQLWKFIAPGLYEKEKKYAASFVLAGTLLFLLGVGFVYFLVYPAAFEFLFNFGGSVDKPLITINEYLSFFLTTTLLFGLSFELPLIIVILGMLGLVDQAMLRKNRRYAIVIMAVVSAIITPPDLISMVMLLVPMILLFEISILIVGFFEKKNQVVA